MMHTRTDEDILDEMIEKIRIVSREDDRDLSQSDLAIENAVLMELRQFIGKLSPTANLWLYLALVSGESIQCNCGRTIEINGYTGEVKIVEAVGR